MTTRICGRIPVNRKGIQQAVTLPNVRNIKPAKAEHSKSVVEFEKNGRSIKVRIEGAIVYVVGAAVAIVGIAYVAHLFL